MGTYEYITTCSGNEEDFAGEQWVGASNVFDDDPTTSGTSYVVSFIYPFGPTTVPYSWYWSYTNSLWVTSVNNTLTSGTVIDVYIQIYGHREQEDYKDSMFEVLPYVGGDFLWFHSDFMLSTISGSEFVSVCITPAKENWSWDDINTLELDIYAAGGPWTDRVDFYVTEIKCLIIVEEE
jgi:hypothetical protein